MVTPLRSLSWRALWLALLPSFSCANFPSLSPGVCGNAVVESGEDCDGFAGAIGTSCGTPGTKTQCRYQCGSAAKGASCPAAWGCGADGICRAPSGAFAAQGAPIEGAARLLVPADFDGDGRLTLVAMGDDDALGRRIGRIVDPDGPAVNEIPAPLTPPAVADIDGDGKADVAFADLRGIAVTLGNSAHAADFVSYASVLPGNGHPSFRAMPMDVLPDLPGDEVVALVDPNDGTGASLKRVSDRSSDQANLVHLPHSQSELIDPIVWGTVDERPSSVCPTIVMAFKDETAVHLFSPCRPGAAGTTVWNEGGALSTVRLPPGATLDTGVRLAFLDGDQHLDLLMGATEGGKPVAFAALGHGDGTFGEGGMASLYPLPAVATQSTNLPIALADLNDDGLVDFIVPEGVVTSTVGATVKYALTTNNLGAAWTGAVVADFDLNGTLDVVAVSNTEENLVFLTNAGGSHFNSAAVPTMGPPTHLVTGDFDGDLLPDVAFSEHAVSGDQWTIAFGSGHGPPTVVTRMGRLDAIEQISRARLSDGTSVDGIDDLVVVSDNPATDEDSIVYSLGRGERVMLAPFALTDVAGTDLPLTVTVGKLRDSAFGFAALGVDTSSGRLRLWYVPADTHATDQIVSSVALPSDFHPDDGASLTSFRYGAHIVAGEVDGDTVDDILLLAPYGAGSTGSALLVAHLDATTHEWVLGAPVPLDVHCTLYTPLALADVDGDGAPDVILKPEDDSPTDILVFWNDGKGGFDGARSSKLSVTGGLYAFACANIEGRCSLYAAAPDQTYAVDVSNRTFSTRAVTGLPGGRAIASADFNGDGLQDLALGDDNAISVFTSVPVLP